MNIMAGALNLENLNGKKADRQARIAARNAKIRRRFQELFDKGFRIEKVLEMMEPEFLPLSADTIYMIAGEHGYYKSTRSQESKI